MFYLLLKLLKKLQFQMIGKKEALKMGLGLVLHAKYWLLFTLDDYAIAISYSPMREL